MTGQVFPIVIDPENRPDDIVTDDGYVLLYASETFGEARERIAADIRECDHYLKINRAHVTRLEGERSELLRDLGRLRKLRAPELAGDWDVD